MPSAPSLRLSALQVAWRHLASQWESSIGVAVALLLALLPAGLVLIDRSGARSDLQTVIAGSGGLTVTRTGVADAQTFDAFQRQAQSAVSPRLGQYVDDGSARALAAPYHLNSIASRQPASQFGDGVGVTYVSDLAAHVDVIQGLFPTSNPNTNPAAGDSERMATMPLSQADRIGAQLFDVICVDVPAQGAATTPWCARIVGLWRPDRGADPAWTGPTAPIRLFVQHDDFFAVAAMQPAQNVQAARQYVARPDAITPQNAGAAADAVRQTRTALTAANAGRVTTTLDVALARYASTSVTSFPVELLAAALVPLMTLLALVMARWYVEPRLHELALLRARGWSSRRVRRLVLVELALLGLPALIVAVVGLLAVIWQASDGQLGRRPALSGGEVLAIVVAAAVVVIASARFVDLARWASQQSVLHIRDSGDSVSGSPYWRRQGAAWLLLVPAVALLAIPRVAGAARLHLPGPLDDLGALAAGVAGLVLLVVAVLPLLSVVAEGIRGGRGALEGSMAHVQLRRWWQRNAAAGFLVVLAFAIATYAAVALVDQTLQGPGGGIGEGIVVGLTIGFVSAMATALIVYTLVFMVSCRARVDYHTALLVDGLPAATVRRAVQIEQQAVLLLGLVAGMAIGLALVAATASGIGLGGQAGAVAAPPLPAAVVAGAVATGAIGILAGLFVGAAVRRNEVGFRLVEQGWRST